MAGGSSEKRKLLPDRKCKKKTKLLQNKSTADKKKEELKRLFHQSIDATKKAIEAIREAEDLAKKLEGIVEDYCCDSAVKQLKCALHTCQQAQNNLEQSRLSECKVGFLSIPDVPLKLILNGLSFQDRKNIRLVNKSLMVTVTKLDKQFRNWFINLDDDDSIVPTPQELLDAKNVDIKLNLPYKSMLSSEEHHNIDQILKACHDHIVELNGKSSVMSNIGDSLFKITSLQKLKIEDNFIELSFITPLIDNNARSLKQLELDYSNTNYIVHNGNEFFKLVDFCLTRGHVHQDLKMHKLEYLSLSDCNGELTNLFTSCSQNLQSVSLMTTDLESLEDLECRFSTLKDICINECDGMTGLHQLVTLSSHTLVKLVFLDVDISCFDELDQHFGCLESLEVSNERENLGESAFRNLVHYSSSTLEELTFVDSEQLKFLTCQLNKLNFVNINCEDCSGIPNLLLHCASSVSEICLTEYVNFEECTFDFNLNQLKFVKIWGPKPKVGEFFKAFGGKLKKLYCEGLDGCLLSIDDSVAKLEYLELHDCRNGVKLIESNSSTLKELIVGKGGADLNCLSLDLKFDKLEMMKVDTENREFGKLNVPPDIEILHEDCEMKEFPF